MLSAPSLPALRSHRPSVSIGRLALFCCLVAIIACLTGSPVVAQDLNVVTVVSRQLPQQQHPNNSRWEPVSRSLTLFHAGKVYDWVEEVGEVVIFEPAQSRFVILSLNGNKLATNVRYEEIHQLLKSLRHETDKYIDELRARPQSPSRRVIQALEFQLDPQFADSFDEANGKLRLASEFVNYVAETAEVERLQVTQQYLDWADWTARLNYVLHPQAVTPEARIALNNALRKRERIPTQVNLTLSIDEELQLRAEHFYTWNLSTHNRRLIANWEQERTGKDVRWVDLREYQRVLVTASSRRGR